MPVTYTQSVAAEVRANMARQGLNRRQLAIILGWDRRYLQRRLTGAVAWSTDDLEQAAKALSIPLTELVSPRAA